MSLSSLLHILVEETRIGLGQVALPKNSQPQSLPLSPRPIPYPISSRALLRPGTLSHRVWAQDWRYHTPCLAEGLSEAGTAVGDGWLLLRVGLESRGPVAGGVGPLIFASEKGVSCWGAGLGLAGPEGLSGSSGSCLELVAFFMAGGVSGGVSGTRADIGGGGGGGEGSPSGEGLGSGGVLATTAGRPTQERRVRQYTCAISSTCSSLHPTDLFIHATDSLSSLFAPSPVPDTNDIKMRKQPWFPPSRRTDS